jgi:hypothetical protein
VGEALGGRVARDGLEAAAARAAGASILAGNARALYRLPAATSGAAARPGGS